jgi:hypothetical protein
MENDWKSFSDPDLRECSEKGMDIEIQMPDGHTFRAFALAA